MPAPLSGSKRKRDNGDVASGKTAPRAKRDVEPRTADEDDSVQSDGDAAGFAAVFDKVMARNITQSATVMAKRHTAAAKLADVMKKEHAQELKKRKERKEAKRIRLVVPSMSAADNEKELRRLATKGVVALFNAITKHQKAISSAQDGGHASSTATAGRGTSAAPTSFLDLLKQASKGIAPAPPQVVTARTSSKPGKSNWKVLQDDYLEQRAEEGSSDDDSEPQKRKFSRADALLGSDDE